MSGLEFHKSWALHPMLFFLAACVLPSPASRAAAAAPPQADAGQANTASPSKTINDKSNYLGDKVSFSRDIMVQVEAADGTLINDSSGKPGRMCLPRKYELRGGNSYTANGSRDNSTPETGTRFTLIQEPRPSEVKRLLGKLRPSSSEAPAPASCSLDVPNASGSPADTLKDQLKNGTVVRVSSTQLSDTPPDRVGFTYGALTVPLKYHLTGTKDFTGSASVGPYVGFRTDNEGLGYGVTLIGFLAASNISVPNTASTAPGSSSSTQSLFGVSYGVGGVFTLKGSFQIGIVLGADRVNQSANYSYNGKGWLALEIGYDFLQ